MDALSNTRSPAHKHMHLYSFLYFLILGYEDLMVCFKQGADGWSNDIIVCEICCVSPSSLLPSLANMHTFRHVHRQSMHADACFFSLSLSLSLPLKAHSHTITHCLQGLAPLFIYGLSPPQTLRANPFQGLLLLYCGKATSGLQHISSYYNWHHRTVVPVEETTSERDFFFQEDKSKWRILVREG